MPAESPATAGAARSLYVHAPFCARRCTYCDFAIQVGRSGDLDGWIEAVAAELSLAESNRAPALADDLDTLYVGGGTPSLLGPGAMERLAGVVGASRLANPELEWTAEANPESVSPGLMGRWVEAGVNRLSLGVQTFHEPTLRWMGRLHGPDGARRSVRDARAAGVDNLSVDLIFGVPEHLGRNWSDDLDRVVDLEPDHVSLYGLTVESGTALGRAVREGREPDVDDERYADEFLEADEALTRAGFEHYEVSSFARPARRSRHNAMYWSGRPWLGLGNGAHSYDPPVRRWNERDWSAYRSAVLEGRSPEASREQVGGEAHRLERVWLALRTTEGWSSEEPASREQALVDGWVGRGLARIEGGRVVLTPRGWLVLDRLTVDLDTALG